AMAALVRAHVDQYVASLTPATTASTSPSTTTPVTSAVAARPRATGSTAAAGDSRDPAEVIGLSLLVVVAVGAATMTARRRLAHRRTSSSARRSAGSVTGSAQANRSHT